MPTQTVRPSVWRRSCGRSSTNPAAHPGPVPPAAARSPHRRYYGNRSRKRWASWRATPAAMLNQLKQQAAAIAAADRTRTVVPALELVTPAAQPNQGGRLYRARMKRGHRAGRAVGSPSRPADHRRPAGSQHSRGRSQRAGAVPAAPNVTWRSIRILDVPSSAPGEVVGTMDAAAINGAIRTLADLVTSEHLPPKILVVHALRRACSPLRRDQTMIQRAVV